MRHVPGSTPINGLVRAYLAMLIDPTSPINPLIAQFAPDHITDLIAAAAASGDPTAHQNDARFGILSRERLASARRYIRQHLDDPLLCDDGIAVHVSISSSQLRKDFEREGLSLGRYIRERRLNMAMAMLQDPSYRRYRVIDVAFACGFRNLVTFNRAFRNAYGATPSEFRPD